MKPVALFLAGLLLASPVISIVHAYAATPEETIAARKANRKRTGDIADGIKKALAGGATAESQLAATQELDTLAHAHGALYPPGTETGGETKALPAIWTNRAGFDEADAANVAAVDKLLAAAKSGDTAAFTTQFGAVGATCGACHRNFRAR
jgi:cytochrome c556